MKKTALLFTFCLSTLLALAQYTSNGVYKTYPQITSTNDTVLVFIFNGITNLTDLTYTGPGKDINWYKFDNLTTPDRAGTRDLYPDDATGYVLDVDGKKTAIWIIDYKNYLPVLKSIEPDLQSASPCNELNLLIDATIPNLRYKTISGNTYSLPRNFTVKYPTKKWEGTKWSNDSVTMPVSLPVSNLSVTAPLCDSKFKLIGDQYATDLRIDPISVSSKLYQAVKVECHVTTVVTSRDRDLNNEADAPNSQLPIRFSAPIDIQFLSNANDPATYFEWKIYKNNQIIINRKDRDHRYTFTDYGEYKVKITASNSICSFSDSITINTIEAAIKVPNVFTPNGDTFNDEFRVAYKSLLGFECWVYNRWGRKVFYWNDPQKGWDGKINGRDAAEGAYFYVIKATGYGLDPKTKDVKTKSSITLKGNINLLRGLKK